MTLLPDVARTSIWSHMSSRGSSSATWMARPDDQQQQQQQQPKPASPRPRAQTVTNALLASWRRPASGHSPPPLPVQSSTTPLPLDDLIDALTPPAVPSLAHARALPSSLASSIQLPSLARLNPVWSALCDRDKPAAFQAAGWDALAVYWEHREAPPMSIADRVTYLSLFLADESEWSTALWEPRFKALRSVTRWGAETLGIESKLVGLLQHWIATAFAGLLAPDDVERTERERCVDLLSEFLAQFLQSPLAVPRIPDDLLLAVLAFYSSLVTRAMDTPLFSDSTEAGSRPTHTHKRHASSMSIPSLPSPTSPFAPSSSLARPSPRPKRKHPFALALCLLLAQLDHLLRALASPSALHTLLPLLFRALAFCASPLPRLSLTGSSSKRRSKDGDDDAGAEVKIEEYLLVLLSGPYTSTCTSILKKHLSPPPSLLSPGSSSLTNGDLAQAAQTSLGAHRLLRTHTRRLLTTRLARAYISREASTSYAHTGAPAHLHVAARDVMEGAWPRDDLAALGVGFSGGPSAGKGWDAAGVRRPLVRAVERWIGVGRAFGAIAERDAVLEEVAGLVRDVLREFDVREEIAGGADPGGGGEAVGLEDDEAQCLGEVLRALVDVVNAPEIPDLILPLSTPSLAPTPLLRDLSALLSQPTLAAPNLLSPPLSAILLRIASRLSDADTAALPVVMHAQGELMPGGGGGDDMSSSGEREAGSSGGWLGAWESLLMTPALLKNRPKTRTAVLAVLKETFDALRDMRTYRRPLAELVRVHCTWILAELAGVVEQQQQRQEVDVEIEAESVVWRVLAEEIVLRCAEGQEEAVSEGSHDDLDALGVRPHLDLLIAATLSRGPVDSMPASELADVAAESAISTAELDAASSPSTHTPWPLVSSVGSSTLFGSIA